MHEGHGRPPRSRPGCPVDEGNALRLESLQDGLDVPHAVPDVVHALAATIEELPNRGVGTERPQDLDIRRSDPEQDLVDPLILDPLPMDRLDTERPAILIHGRIEVADGDPDVIDLQEDGAHGLRADGATAGRSFAGGPGAALPFAGGSVARTARGSLPPLSVCAAGAPRQAPAGDD